MLRKLLTILILPFFATYAYADFEVGSQPVTVDSFINVDSTSTVTLNSNITEVGILQDVLVRILDRNNNPIPNRTVQIYVDGNPSSVTLTQPASTTDNDGYAIGKFISTSPGIYTIKAIDSTYSQDINLVNNADITVYPIPTPTMIAEPYYTKGSSNRVFWHELVGLSTYQYEIVASKSSNFSSGNISSGWISGLSYEFNDLSSSSLYYFKVRARNIGGEVSAWSTPVFSTQDNISPIIRVVDITRLFNNKVFAGISVRVDVTDNFQLDNVKFFCVRENGDKEECGVIEKSGSRYYINIPTSQLEREIFGEYLDKYSFCVSATDKAGNTSQNCDISIEVSKYIETPLPIITNIVNSIIKYINDNLGKVGEGIEETIAQAHFFALTIVSLILYILSIFLALAILAQSIFVVPNFILFNLINFASYLRFRHTGSVLGYVYDSITGKPIKFAKVYIYDGSNVLIRADVTNLNGEFNGRIDTGKYRLVVDISNYLFPSQLYKERELPKNGKLYNSEYVVVTKKTPMNLAIPLDPINMYSDFEKELFMKKRLKRLVKLLALILSIAGFAISIITFDRYPNIYTILLLILYIPTLLIFLKSVFGIRLKKS